MKDLFPEFYNDTNLEDIWDDATFIPDTCVLLNVYDYAPASSKHLLDILSKLAAEKRIWIPYQFAYEYHKNLIAMRGKVEHRYSAALKEIKSASNVSPQMRAVMDLRVKKSGFRTDQSDVNALQKIIDEDVREILDGIEAQLVAFKELHMSRLDSDDVEGELAQLLDSCVGKPPCKSELARCYEVAQSRIGWNIPLIPPSKGNKDKPECYGDFVAWEQIKAWAGQPDVSKHVILISDDNDWYSDKDKPHPYLVRQMYAEANVFFHAITTPQFRVTAAKLLGIYASDSAAQEDEIREEFVETEESSQPKYDEIVDTELAFTANEGAANELAGLRFEDTNFYSEQLRCANLKGAKFYRCDFRNADLSGTNLSEASFILCDLKSANLIGADLTKMRAHACEFDDCILPDGQRFDGWTELEEYTDDRYSRHERRRLHAESIRRDICEE